MAVVAAAAVAAVVVVRGRELSFGTHTLRTFFAFAQHQGQALWGSTRVSCIGRVAQGQCGRRHASAGRVCKMGGKKAAAVLGATRHTHTHKREIVGYREISPSVGTYAPTRSSKPHPHPRALGQNRGPCSSLPGV